MSIAAVAGLAGGDARAVWRVMLRDRGKTASPNPAGRGRAMAGALGRVLEKPGAYRLGEGSPPG